MIRLLLCLVAFSFLGQLLSNISANGSVDEPVVPVRPCLVTGESRCLCGTMTYNGKEQFVTNCTNAKFNNADALRNISSDTEVLIFKGNNVSELPANVFGMDRNLLKLKSIVFSGNNIRLIKGKSFHHAPNVESIELNDNSIALSTETVHPRIFSNFEHLKSLSMVAAFSRESDHDQLFYHLRNIFEQSNLTNLQNLSLQHNGLRVIKDREVFCNLSSLQHLYLSDNELESVDFDVTCLRSLRSVDLSGNKIEMITEEQLDLFDELPERNQMLELYLAENPFTCVCSFTLDFNRWLSETKVYIRDLNDITCSLSANEYHVRNISTVNCTKYMLKNHPVYIALIVLGLVLLTLATLIIIFRSICKCVFSLNKYAAHPMRIMTNSVHYRIVRKGEWDEGSIVDVKV